LGVVRPPHGQIGSRANKAVEEGAQSKRTG